MAFIVGLRLFSYGLAGAAVIITHETTKAAIKEKLYNWLPDKLKRRSYEPAPQSDPEPVSNSDEAGLFPCPVEQVKAEDVSAADALCVEAAGEIAVDERPAEPATLCHVAVNPTSAADSFTAAVTVTIDAVNATGEAVNGVVAEATPINSHPIAVSTSTDAVMEAAPDPAAPTREGSDPASPTGIGDLIWKAVDAVRTMGIKVFGWLAGKFKRREPDPDDGSREFGGWTVDPEVLSKLIRISAKLAWLAVDVAALEMLKRSKVGLQIYKIVKTEIRSWL